MIDSSRIAGLFARRPWRVALLTLVAVGAMAAFRVRAQQANLLSDDELVREHYPSDLLSEASVMARTGGPSHRGQAFVPAVFPGAAGGDLVAAYDNGFGGAVRVLRRDGQQVRVIDSPRFQGMGGSDCGVSLVDLEADGVPEIVASFGAPAGGHLTWLFRFTGAALSFMGPAEPDQTGSVISALHDVTFRDLDGDGTMEAVDSIASDEQPGVFRVFKLVNGSFALWKQLLHYAELGRDGQRSTVIDATVQGPAGVHTMSIINGLPGQMDTRFRSAVVTWNGATLVPASDFGSDVGSIQTPVQLSGGADALRIDLRGSLDGQMAVLIE